jgi:phosphohistidine phosphatase
MKRLFLLRHAKARADQRVADHDRPLAKNGVEAAARIGAHLARSGAEPSLILCSSSRRAVETLDRIRAALPGEPEVSIERELYLATPSALLARVARVDAREAAVLVLAHNPGIGELARALAGDGDRAGLARLAAQFPPGACASFHFELASWGGLSLGAGRLTGFAIPQDMD